MSNPTCTSILAASGDTEKALNTPTVIDVDELAKARSMSGGVSSA